MTHAKMKAKPAPERLLNGHSQDESLTQVALPAISARLRPPSSVELKKVQSLVGLSAAQIEIFKGAARDVYAHENSCTCGGDLRMIVPSTEAAVQLVRDLGFLKVNERWTLTNPRFVKRVDLEHGIEGLALAEVDRESPAGMVMIRIQAFRDRSLV